LTGKSSAPDDDTEVVQAEVLDTYAPNTLGTLEERRLAARLQMEDIEDDLYIEALDTVRGLMKFAELDVEAGEVPDEWVLEYGAAKAQKMYKLAQMGNMCRKDAPIGIQVALDLAKSERRARSHQDAPATKLAVAVVVMPKPGDMFPTIEVDDVEEY
jgi:hypothetical protein